MSDGLSFVYPQARSEDFWPVQKSVNGSDLSGVPSGTGPEAGAEKLLAEAIRRRWQALTNGSDLHLTIVIDRYWRKAASGPGAKRPFISASRPIRSETGEADLLLTAIENLSDGVPSCPRAAAIPSYCSQRYFDPRGVEK